MGRLGFKGFVILCALSFINAKAQVTMSTNLLHVIPLNKALIFEVKIKKGKLGDYSKLQLEVPQGVLVREVESREGTFEVEDNKAKVIWVLTPADSLISVRMKIGPVLNNTEGTVIFKYYFLEDDNKKEFEALPFPIVFKDTTLPVLLSAPMMALTSKDAPPLPLPIKDTTIAAGKNPAEVAQQIKQLKEDSKEAYLVGDREKKLALMRLDSLSEMEKKIPEIADESERTEAQNLLDTEKTKVKEQIVLADRVLTLAKTLQGQAEEVERMNSLAIAEGKKSKTKTQEKKPVVVPTVSQTVSIPATVTLENKTASSESSGIIFRLQVGAFSQQPDMALFKNLGEITVVNENSVYKVLAGSYTSREEASRKKEELKRRAMDCFVVTYENGVRVR